MTKRIKKIIIIPICIILAVLLAFGIMSLVRALSKKPVKVYRVSDIGDTDFMGGMTETYGIVTADKIQKVFLSPTQTLTEIRVKEGDEVRIGDEILSYDTSLGALDVKKAEIALEKLKLELSETESFLDSLNRALISENLEAQISVLEDELAREEERIAAIRPTYPSLPVGSFSEDDPMYVESEGDIDLDELISDLGAGEEKYIVFVTVEDGDYLDYKGVRLYCDDGGRIKLGFFDPIPLEAEYPEFEDNREKIQSSIDNLTVLMSSSYSSTELAEMKSTKSKEIKDLEVRIKVAELDYKQKSAEVGNGVIYSTVDGIVKTVREDPGIDGEATVEISGGGGYYIKCAIGEFDIGSVEVGDSVDVNSWSDGTYCSGEVFDIDTSTLYSGDDFYSDGNSIISNYTMTVFVSEDNNLTENDYVSVSYQKNSGDGVWYISNMFIRYENGKPYVMARSEKDTIEKRFIQTGLDFYGDYTEIKDGLDMDDMIAFPYGKDVVAGAKTVDGDIEDLYGDDYGFYY